MCRVDVINSTSSRIGLKNTGAYGKILYAILAG